MHKLLRLFILFFCDGNYYGYHVQEFHIFPHCVNIYMVWIDDWTSLTSIEISGVAVGCGWQQFVAYVNIGCYYIVGVPLGVVLGFVFKLGVKVVDLAMNCWYIYDTVIFRYMLLTYVSWYAYRQGIWGGMIGGTAMQTAILLWVTIRTDWNKEVPVTKPME
jgi:MATE family multidrug resistance protein